MMNLKERLQKIKLYQEFSEKELSNLLQEDIDNTKLETLEEPVYGDFIVRQEYGFKKCLGHYQCLFTPEEVHIQSTFSIITPTTKKAKNYYTKYKTPKGGKDKFNPVTKTGGTEDPKETSRKLRL